MPLLSPPFSRRYSSDESVKQRVDLVLRAWVVLLLMAAVAQIAVGCTLLLSGEDGLQGGIFANSNWIPWWLWGATSIGAGLLIPFSGPLRNIGVTVAVVWYGLWWGLLGASILSPPSDAPTYPTYPLAIYGFLTGLHVLLWAVEFLTSNPWAGKARDGA